MQIRTTCNHERCFVGSTNVPHDQAWELVEYLRSEPVPELTLFHYRDIDGLDLEYVYIDEPVFIRYRRQNPDRNNFTIHRMSYVFGYLDASAFGCGYSHNGSIGGRDCFSGGTRTNAALPARGYWTGAMIGYDPNYGHLYGRARVEIIGSNAISVDFYDVDDTAQAVSWSYFEEGIEFPRIRVLSNGDFNGLSEQEFPIHGSFYGREHKEVSGVFELYGYTTDNSARIIPGAFGAIRP